jgi:oligopeptide transport system ATP-binding protein
MTILEVEGLSKQFQARRRAAPVVAVDHVTFSLDRGRTVAIVGESGAGKSTVGRLITRLIEPDSGAIRVDGSDVLRLGGPNLMQFRRTVQMIFQDPFNALDPRYSVGRSVAEPLKIHFGLNRTDRERRAQELLGRVGLGSHRVHRYPSQLSGGQLQRVAIARALAVEPTLLVCDEPVAALDASIRAEVLNLLLDLQESNDLSYVFITHDLSTVRVFAHELIVMKAGHVVEGGSTAAVFATPTDPYTRELIAAIPVLDVTSDAPQAQESWSRESIDGARCSVTDTGIADEAHA